jgi:hypothetical protein
VKISKSPKRANSLALSWTSLSLQEIKRTNNIPLSHSKKQGILQIESEDVKVAKKGQLIGLKVDKIVAAGDKVYK